LTGADTGVGLLKFYAIPPLPNALPRQPRIARLATFAREETMTSVIDGYLVDPNISLLDKTRIQAQVLLPVIRALRAELGKDKADVIVKQALRH
jgi:hypothetical protein